MAPLAWTRRLVAAQLLVLAFGCERIAGYDHLKPWPDDAGEGDAGELGGEEEDELDAAQIRLPGEDASATQTEAGAGSDAGGSSGKPDGGSTRTCMQMGGLDACQSLPRFSASPQVVDGVGDEFCNLPAMVVEEADCATTSPAGHPAWPGKVTLRVGWSGAALHVHVHVEDSAIIVQPDRARLWDGDAVEIFIAGASGSALHGAFNGTNDGGAVQLVFTPPSNLFGARGEAFLSRFGAHTALDAALFAGRLVPGGYEIELRYPWASTADTPAAGKRVAFDLALNAQDQGSAGGREFQCLISAVFVDGAEACGLAAGKPAEPYCDDRTWCQPTLDP